MRLVSDEQKKQFEDAKQQVEENCDEILKSVDDIVDQYTHNLDLLMKDIQTDLVTEEDIPVQIVERYFMELSNALYFLSSKVERLGVYDGMGKLTLKEKFNSSYIDNKIGSDGKNRTATELTALSEENSKYESAVSDMYSRAYKIVKAKVDAAQTLNSTLSKIMSHKMSQESMIGTDERLSTKQVLNEGAIYG